MLGGERGTGGAVGAREGELMMAMVKQLNEGKWTERRGWRGSGCRQEWKGLRQTAKWRVKEARLFGNNKWKTSL